VARGAPVPLAVVGAGLRLSALRSWWPRCAVAADRSRSWTDDAPFGCTGSLHDTLAVGCSLGLAPRAEVLDIAALRPSAGLDEQLETLEVAVRHLLAVAADGPLVVLNCWGVTGPTRDRLPSDTPDFATDASHPLTRAFAALAEVADVVFAAGNAGPDNVFSRFAPEAPAIVGAASLSGVITVGAADATGVPDPMSSRGPGALADAKPDLCARTGQQVGDHRAAWTSGAAAVVAGGIARLREDPVRRCWSPGRMAEELRGGAGSRWDPWTGYGVLHVERFVEALEREP